MSNRFSSEATTAQSDNDNGPLTRGQVKVLKIAIGVMSLMIVVALIAIAGRVIYLASSKRSASVPPPVATIGKFAPNASLELPPGATVKRMSIHANHLLVHYEGPDGAAAAVIDLASGATVSRIAITSGPQPDQKPADANR